MAEQAPSPNTKPEPPKRKGRLDPQMARLLTSGTQLAITVAVLVFAGHWLDGYLGTTKPWYALSGAMVGIIVGIRNLLKDFM